MSKTEFLISLFIARFMLSLLEMIILYLFAWIYFGITINGSIPALMLLIVSGNIAFSGIAIFISSRTSNTEIGNGLINAVVTPMMVLSGVFFSYHNFPDWAISAVTTYADLNAELARRFEWRKPVHNGSVDSWFYFFPRVSSKSPAGG